MEFEDTNESSAANIRGSQGNTSAIGMNRRSSSASFMPQGEHRRHLDVAHTKVGTSAITLYLDVLEYATEPIVIGCCGQRSGEVSSNGYFGDNDMPP